MFSWCEWGISFVGERFQEEIQITVCKYMYIVLLNRCSPSHGKMMGNLNVLLLLFISDAPKQVTVTPADPAEVKLAQSITLTCQADGFPSPSYAWKFNGQWNGVTQNTLTITNADVKDAGNYTCEARNGFGFKETTKVVHVRCE